MIVEGVPLRSTGAGQTTAAADAGQIRTGMVLDARILEITDKGMARVWTRLGELQVPVPPKDGALAAAIAAGRFKLLVGAFDPSRGQLQLSVMAPGEGVEASRAAGPAPTAKPADPTNELRQVLSDTVRAAAARQDGMAKLHAGLDQLAMAPDVPRPVRAAATQVMQLRLAVDQGADPAAVKRAVLGSGLFLEADLAGAGPSAATPATRDMKAALLRLDAALTAWLGPKAAPAGPAPQPAPTAPPPHAAQAPVASPLPGRAVPAAADAAVATSGAMGRPGGSGPPPATPGSADVTTAPPTGQVATGSGVPVMKPGDAPPSGASPRPGAPASPERAAAAGPAQAPERAAVVPPAPAGAAMPTTRLAEAQLLVRVIQGLTGQAQAAARVGSGEALRDDPLDETADRPPDRLPERPLRGTAAEILGHALPPPPRRGGPTQAEPAIAASWLGGLSADDVGRIVREETEAALSRVVLSQIASLGPEQEPAQAASDKPPQQWTFDVPILSRGETSIAQFRIEREDQGGSGPGEPSRPTWRIRFSVDLAPIGPVHALLSLTGGRLSIGLWAERPEAVAIIGAGVGELRNALEAGDFEVDEIHLAAGRPVVPERAPTGTFLDRSA